jgi:glycosyltransferase involved in cell wall biosynthesis
MKRYGEYLENCSGFIVCSLYEGLGLPALEAMMRDCPLVVSDIPVFHETCDEAAIFVDPLNRASITRGLEKCALQGEDWSSKSAQGAAQYGLRSAGVGRKWLRMYHDGANIA